MILSALAAAGGLAWLDARSGLWYDRLLLSAIVPTAAGMVLRQYRGRLNQFYALEEHAQDKKVADRPLLRFGDRVYSYAQVHDNALRYGTWLKEKMGVKQGDIVAMSFMNSDNFIFVWYGLWAIGAKPAFINYNLTGKALSHCVKIAGTPLLLVDGDVANTITDEVRSDLAGTRIEIFTSELEADARGTQPVRYPDEVRYDDKVEGMAMLIYTSGTTGLPKAGVVTWGKVIIGAGVSSGIIGTKSDDVFYTVGLPPSTDVRPC